VYNGGKTEGSRQVAEATNKAAVNSSNELGRMKCQYSMAQRLAAWIQCDGGNFEHQL
jgi:hypothetical protein